LDYQLGKSHPAIRGLPAETLTCGILARLTMTNRQSPLGLTQPGTQHDAQWQHAYRG
jgi:hypothetical protein